MEYLFFTTPEFEKSFKFLNKKYHSFKSDFEKFKTEYIKNPDLGDDLGEGFRKIRVAIKSKNKGKRGGARIIVYDLCVKIEDKIAVLIEIYDKSEITVLQEDRYKMILKKFLDSL